MNRVLLSHLIPAVLIFVFAGACHLIQKAARRRGYTISYKETED
jgi:hypothetical protein